MSGPRGAIWARRGFSFVLSFAKTKERTLATGFYALARCRTKKAVFVKTAMVFFFIKRPLF